MPRGRGRGGYRQPSTPAAVSGPGALSQRTDGALPPLPTGGKYGDRKNLEQLRSVGPMTGPTTPAGAAPPPTAPAGPPIDMFAPTERPNEPITAGVPIGPGPNGQSIPADPHTQLRGLYQRAVDEGWPYADHLRSLLEQAGG